MRGRVAVLQRRPRPAVAAPPLEATRRGSRPASSDRSGHGGASARPLSLLACPRGARPLMLPAWCRPRSGSAAQRALALDRVPAPACRARGTPAALSNWDALASALRLSRIPFTSAEVRAPRVRSERRCRGTSDQPGEGSVFVEAVIARDGSVSAVTVLGGIPSSRVRWWHALRRERYEPGRFRVDARSRSASTA